MKSWPEACSCEQNIRMENMAVVKSNLGSKVVFKGVASIGSIDCSRENNDDGDGGGLLIVGRD